MQYSTLISILAAASLGLGAADSTSAQVIQKDVVVVGAGSSGVYTGVKLLDHGKDVLFIESQPVIGGHANTYTDPKTGKNINMGVQVFHNTTTVKDWFSRWNVELTTNVQATSNTSYVDFVTGKINKGFSPPGNAALGAALEGYAQLLSRWPEVQLGLNLTHPVDPDLVLPFGQLLAKYNLTDVAYTAYLFAQGYSPLMNLSSLYVIKNFGLPLISDLQGGLLTAASHNTRQLYDTIYEQLHDRFMVNTTISSIQRTSGSDGVQVRVRQNGRDALIHAKKLVWSAPPTLENLKSANFDLLKGEESLFGQFFANGYYTGIIQSSGLPDNTSLDGSSPSTEYQIGSVPGPYAFATIAGTDLTSIYYGTASSHHD